MGFCWLVASLCRCIRHSAHHSSPTICVARRVSCRMPAPLLITDPSVQPLARVLRSQVETLRSVVTIADLVATPGTATRPVVQPQDIALVQYTSGSTGTPKGVILTHTNLLANIRAMGQAARATSADVFVSWLPLYHDMGLIGAWLGSLYYAQHLVLMSPLTFLARPARWLWAIHTTVAPSPGRPTLPMSSACAKSTTVTSRGSISARGAWRSTALSR